MDFKQQLKLAYDEDAQRREVIKDVVHDWKLEIKEGFLKKLKQNGLKSVLEIGAGVGDDALFFKSKEIVVTVIDLSEKMVEKCKEKGLEAQVLDLYGLEILKKKFDAIYSMNVLLHVPRADLEKVLQNIADTLDGRGLFFYGVYTRGRD